MSMNPKFADSPRYQQGYRDGMLAAASLLGDLVAGTHRDSTPVATGQEHALTPESSAPATSAKARSLAGDSDA